MFCTPSLGMPYVMQRIALLRSSGPADSGCPAAFGVGLLASLACPSAVSGGIFPSGGSTISDVRFSIVRSIITVALPVAFGFLNSCRVGEKREKKIVSAGKSLFEFDVEEPRRPLFQLSDLLVRQELSSFQLLRAFQGRGADVQPDALQIRLAVWCQRRRPRPSSDLRPSPPRQQRRPGHSGTRRTFYFPLHFTFYFLLLTFYFLLSEDPRHRSAHSPGRPSARSVSRPLSHPKVQRNGILMPAPATSR